MSNKRKKGKTMKLVLTVTQVADILQVQKATVYKWARDGDVPAVVIGKTFRIPFSEFCVQTGLDQSDVIEFLSIESSMVEFSDEMD